MSKNEVAVVTGETFDLQVLDMNMHEAMAEEMDGLGTIPYDTVKIPSGGGLAFEVPTDDEDTPEMVTELVGVILDHHPVNGYWKEKFDGQNNQPDCASYDGKVGIATETGECKDCATCPYNQFGSGEGGKGKACKNMHRCYILREGNPVPLLLVLPPTSLKGLRDYIGKKVVLKGKRSYEVITKIKLVKEKSGDGITYSRATFTSVGTLSGDKLAMAKAYAESIKGMNRNVEITADDLATPEQAKPATEVPADGQFHEANAEASEVFTEAEEAIFEQADAKQEELPV